MIVEKHGSVVTQNGARYIHTLCKHFAHKVESSWNESEGAIRFAMGTCTLIASNEALVVLCRASTTNELDEVAECIRDHFERFAYREGLKLAWET